MAILGRQLSGQIEVLLYSDTYKLLLVTGQPQPEPNGNPPRHAYISAKAYNEFQPDELAALKKIAKPDDGNSGILFVADALSLNIISTATGTTNPFPLERLDADVQARLKQDADGVWQKFLAAAQKAPAPQGAKQDDQPAAELPQKTVVGRKRVLLFT